MNNAANTVACCLRALRPAPAAFVCKIATPPPIALIHMRLLSISFQKAFGDIRFTLPDVRLTRAGIPVLSLHIFFCQTILK